MQHYTDISAKPDGIIAGKSVYIPQLNLPMVQSGMLYVEIYPMLQEEHGARLTESGETATYYDVMIRPDDWPSTMNQPVIEWECLSYKEASQLVDLILGPYPEIEVTWL